MENEHARLKRFAQRAPGAHDLEVDVLKEMLGKNDERSPTTRGGGRHGRRGISQRRAYVLVPISDSSLHSTARPRNQGAEIQNLARRYPRYGYWRMWACCPART